MKHFQYLLGAFLFVVVGTLIGWGLPHPVTTPTQSSLTNSAQSAVQQVSVMLDEGEGTVKIFERLPFTDGESLFDVTERLAQQNKIDFTHDQPGKYGTLITGIDGKKNGTSGAYWLYWVNNHAGEVGADQYKLTAGDTIEWKFINMKF